MELVSYRKSNLGTMRFTLKIGRMKKAEDFITYPVQKDDDGHVVYLQSSHRWVILYCKTGQIEMSARREQYANSMWMIVCRARGTTERDQATPEQLETMLSAIRATASPNCGGNNALHIYCDNSNAALV